MLPQFLFALLAIVLVVALLLTTGIDPIEVVLFFLVGLISFGIGVGSRWVVQDYVIAAAFVIAAICFWIARYDIVSWLTS